ncbi:hypothetical protein HZQ04_17760 [Elizabethkingia anophelis]|nr:hypothetical protein [Elizabethkingia anophelis]
MEIINIFAGELFAFRFAENSLDEYRSAIDQWNDISYLKKYYEDNNTTYIKNNPFFPISGLEDFVDFISENATEFDEKLNHACEQGSISDYFEILSKGKDLHEILPKKKSKHHVLRLYGIQLGSIVIITGSAIKLTAKMRDHPDTDRQLVKLNSVQDFLRGHSINDEETFFDYLND